MLGLLLWYIPFDLAFNESNIGKKWDEMSFFEIITIIIFVVDIFINLNLT